MMLSKDGEPLIASTHVVITIIAPIPVDGPVDVGGILRQAADGTVPITVSGYSQVRPTATE